MRVLIPDLVSLEHKATLETSFRVPVWELGVFLDDSAEDSSDMRLLT